MTKRRSHLEYVAYHEAGHAVAAVRLGVPFHHVTIEPEEGSLGHLLHKRYSRGFLDACSNGYLSPNQEHRLDALTVVCFAGPEAERRIRGRYNHQGAAQDYAHAQEFACDRRTRFQSEDADRAYYRWRRVVARDFIQDERTWLYVESVADALLDRQRLSSNEVGEVTGRELRRETRRDSCSSLATSEFTRSFIRQR